MRSGRSPGTEPEVLVDAATVRDLTPDSYFVTLRPGADREGYADGLGRALQKYGVVVGPNDASSHSGTILALSALTGLLSLTLVVVAGLAVLNTGTCGRPAPAPAGAARLPAGRTWAYWSPADW
jgi:hypothetical protein